MEREHHHLQFEVQQDRHHHRYRCEDAAPRTPLASLKNTSSVSGVFLRPTFSLLSI